MKNNILVVGGTGFIGYHLLKSLRKKNKVFLYLRISQKIRKLKNVNYIFL